MNTMLCLFALLISLTVITSSIAPIRIDTTCHDERYFYSSALNLCILNTRYFESWAWAFLYCQREGGNLPSIHNAFQNSLIAELQFNLTGKTQSWLGAEKYDGQWSWIDKSPFDYQRFDKKNSSGCFVCDGALLDATDLLWKPVDSSTYNSFICVAPPFIPTTTTRDPSVTTDSFGCYPAHKQPPFNCKEGWQYAPELGYEYLVFSDSFYDDTETYCVSQGAHLVSIHSEAENDFVAGLCCVSSDHYLDAGFYITGGVQQNGTLKWLDGSAFDFKHEWCGGEPWDHADEGILYIVNTESRGQTECLPKTWGLDYNFVKDKSATPYYVCKRKRNA
ncbi:unnamed protein product, partial [Mesorhabditis belari]|uniref:C-type lectin domain-containing protein n=1 Tax=Mesorhabditis belari TaxID=2138241 RepID=A0AAF3FI53_9BILA